MNIHKTSCRKHGRFLFEFVVLVSIVAIVAPGVSGMNHAGNHDADSSAFAPAVWGLEFGASDLEAAVDFYKKALDFEMDSACRAFAPVLRNGSFRLVLSQVDASPSGPDAAKVILNMRVRDFKSVISLVEANGGTIADTTVLRFALGTFIKIQDPAGNHVNLLRLDGDATAAGSKSAVYNIGVRQENLESSEWFYSQLGFTPYSRNFLPKVLPLNKSGAAMLVLHGTAKAPAALGARNGIIILSVSDSAAVRNFLKARGFAGRKENTSADFVLLQDPSGNQIKLFERTLLESTH